MKFFAYYPYYDDVQMGTCPLTMYGGRSTVRPAPSFTYIMPEGEPFNAWGASWAGSVHHNINVQELRKNQHLFNYHPRIVVE